MGIFLRFILFFFSITIIIIAFLSLLVGFEFFSQEYLNNLIDSLYNNFEYKILLVAVSLLFILIGLYITYRSLFFKRNNTTFSTNSTDSGQIKISVNTIESIALSSIKKMDGVKEPKIKVKIDSEENVSLVVTILIVGDRSIPEVSEEIQNKIKDSIEQIAGLSVKHVEVIVSDVSGSNKLITKKSKLE